MSLYYSSSIDYISGKSYNNKIGYQYADVDDQKLLDALLANTPSSMSTYSIPEDDTSLHSNYSNCDTPDGPPNNDSEKIIPNSEEPLFIKEAVQAPIEVVSLLSEDLKACSNNSSENDAFSPSTPPFSSIHNDLFHGTAEIASQSSASQLIGVLFKKCKDNNLSLDYDITCYDLRVAEDDYTVDNDIPQLDLSNSIISFGVDKFVLCPIGTSVPVIEITILPITQMDSIETISIQYSILDTYKKSPLKDLSKNNSDSSGNSSTGISSIIKTNSISSANSSNSNDNSNNNNSNNNNNSKKSKHKRHSSFLPPRPQWLPNSASSQCMYPGCRMTFSIISLNRRHHCRCCGKLYCTDHSKYQIKLPSLGYNTPQRVCKICYENCTKGYVDADIKSFEKQASQTPPPIVDNECIVCRFDKKPIGLKLESDVYGRNARVSGFERSSEGQVFNAESDGRIKIGQYILSINGQSTIGLKFNQILDFVQDSICPIEIRLGGLSPEVLQQYDLTHKVSLTPPVWVPDESSTVCMFDGCHNEFSKTIFDFKYRRHHCRSCGKIFCIKHCYKKILLSDFGYIGPQRVCNTCYNMHTASDENSFCYNASSNSSQEKQLGQRGSLDSSESNFSMFYNNSNNSRCSALGCSKVFDSLFHGGEVKYFCTCCDRPFCAEHVKRKMCLPKRNIFQEVNVCDQCYYQQMGDSDLESYCLPVTNLDTGQTFLLHEVLNQTNRTNPSNPIV